MTQPAHSQKEIVATTKRPRAASVRKESGGAWCYKQGASCSWTNDGAGRWLEEEFCGRIVVVFFSRGGSLYTLALVLRRRGVWRRAVVVAWLGVWTYLVAAWMLVGEHGKRSADVFEEEEEEEEKAAARKDLVAAEKNGAVRPNYYSAILKSRNASEPGLPDACAVWDPMTVIYNRIPKCGSGSVNIFMTAAQEVHGHQQCRSTVYTARSLGKRAVAEFRRNPFTASSCKKRIDINAKAVLNRHVFFVPMPARAKVAYVNVIREPVARCASRFYYERDARGAVDGTIDACLDGEKPCPISAWRPTDIKRWSRARQLGEECASNYLTRWFCGHAAECSPKYGALREWTGPPEPPVEMLELALSNLARHHAAVGLVERLSDSLRLFAATVPGFFSGVDLINPCNKCNPNRTFVTNPPPSPHNAAKLAAWNALDVALYDYAARLFAAKLKACDSSGSSFSVGRGTFPDDDATTTTPSGWSNPSFTTVGVAPSIYSPSSPRLRRVVRPSNAAFSSSS